MVRILTIAALLIATVTTQVQAAANCQCLFQDGSNCCVFYDGNSNNLDCQAVCTGALRGKDDKPCAAGGKYTPVSYWKSLWRQSCKGTGEGQ